MGITDFIEVGEGGEQVDLEVPPMSLGFATKAKNSPTTSEPLFEVRLGGALSSSVF